MIDIPWTMIDNRIVRIIENPCDIDFWALVKLAVAPAENSLDMIVSPQPQEFLESTIEVSRGYKGSKYRRKRDPETERDNRRRRRRRRRRGFPQIEDVLLEAVASSQKIKGAQVGPLEYLFHVAHAWTERITFWWLVYDAVDKFFYNWHSSILQSDYCTAQALAAVTSTTGPTTMNSPGPFLQPPWNVSVNRGGHIASSLDYRVNFVARATAAFSFSGISTPYAVSQPSILLQAVRDGNVVWEVSQTQNVQPDEEYTLGVSFTDTYCDRVVFNISGESQSQVHGPGQAHAVWLP